jgi:hypothetical protein
MRFELVSAAEEFLKGNTSLPYSGAWFPRSIRRTIKNIYWRQEFYSPSHRLLLPAATVQAFLPPQGREVLSTLSFER